MRVNRFVLDANIWVSYLITETEQNLIDIIADNDLTVFRCDELLTEVARVLHYPRLLRYNVNVPYALKVIKGATTPFEIQNIPSLSEYIPSDKDVLTI